MKTFTCGANPGVDGLIENLKTPFTAEVASAISQGDLIKFAKNSPCLFVKGVSFCIRENEWVRIITLDYAPHETDYLA